MTQLPHAKGRVLLVEAKPARGDRYERCLLEAGFRVAAARNGRGALAKAAAERFDVVLLDLAMPGSEAPDLLRGLREHSPEVPVILMLDKSQKELALPRMGEGVQRLVKPIDASTLKRAVISAVQASHREPRATFHNRRGERVEPSLLSATDAKNEFGKVLEKVMQGGVVVVTKHGASKAVILSLEDFNALSAGAARELDTLASEFDALLDHMQTPEARAGMETAFNASPEALGKAAVSAARKRA